MADLASGGARICLCILFTVASLGLVSLGATTEGVTPIFVSWKNWRPSFSHHRLSFRQYHPIFSWKADDLFCSSPSLLLILLECHPLEGVTPHLFYLFDLVYPLFFVNSDTKKFSFGCHPPEGVTRDGPPPSDATACLCVVCIRLKRNLVFRYLQILHYFKMFTNLEIRGLYYYTY